MSSTILSINPSKTEIPQTCPKQIDKGGHPSIHSMSVKDNAREPVLSPGEGSRPCVSVLSALPGCLPISQSRMDSVKFPVSASLNFPKAGEQEQQDTHHAQQQVHADCPLKQEDYLPCLVPNTAPRFPENSKIYIALRRLLHQAVAHRGAA